MRAAETLGNPRDPQDPRVSSMSGDTRPVRPVENGSTHFSDGFSGSDPSRERKRQLFCAAALCVLAGWMAGRHFRAGSPALCTSAEAGSAKMQKHPNNQRDSV